MVQENDNPQVSLKPEEDARLPILEAQIETQWRRWRPGYVRLLEKRHEFEEMVKAKALMCVHILHQYEAKGLGADMAREVVQEEMMPPGSVE